MIGLSLASVAGGFLLPGVLAGDVSKMLITFLGLVSASILPTISLIIGSMTSSSRSVQAIDKLEVELSAAMNVLFFLFGLVGCVVVALLSLAMPSPAIFDDIPYLTAVLPRLGQAIVCGASLLIILRAGQIPAILRRSMRIRHEIATDEARKRTSEKAPKAGEAKALFPTHPDFGKSVKLADIADREKH